MAVVGLQETLEALANGQVEELLIGGVLDESHPLPKDVKTIFAPEIPAPEGGTESEKPRQVFLPELWVTKASQTGAIVTFIEDATLLEIDRRCWCVPAMAGITRPKRVSNWSLSGMQ